MLNVKTFYVKAHYLRSNSALTPIWFRKNKFVPLPQLEVRRFGRAVAGRYSRSISV